MTTQTAKTWTQLALQSVTIAITVLLALATWSYAFGEKSGATATTQQAAAKERADHIDEARRLIANEAGTRADADAAIRQSLNEQFNTMNQQLRDLNQAVTGTNRRIDQLMLQMRTEGITNN